MKCFRFYPVLSLALAAIMTTACTQISHPPIIQPTPSQVRYCGDDGQLVTQRLIQSHRSYCLKSDASATALQPNIPSRYQFSIIDDRGETLKNFSVVHEKIMHVIVVRKDLAEFQHVHPDFNATNGEFTLSAFTLPSAGPYRLFADFTPTGGQQDPHGNPLGVTIHEDLAVGDATAYTPQPLGPPTRTQLSAGYSVALNLSPEPLKAGRETELRFTIKRNNEPVVNLENYLGARGHAVILREGDLEFLHTHPQPTLETEPGNIAFDVTFNQPGRYKVFMQFQHKGQVITTDFVLTVEAGPAEASEGIPAGNLH